MSNYALQSSTRTALGRRVRSLRKTGVIPANIFGKKIDSLPIQVEQKALKDILKKAGETGLINLSIEGGKTYPVLVAGYAQHPVTGDLLHVDFHAVDLTVKTTAMVPLRAVGESEGVKSGNILVLQRNEIEVEALPADLPEHIDVDIAKLTEVGSTLHAKDLVFDRAKVTLMVDDDETIATIQEPAKEEEPVAAAEPTEGEKSEGGEDAAKAGATEDEAKTDDKKE